MPAPLAVPDLADVLGQEQARWALEVAAAGGAPASYGGIVPGPTMDPHAYVLDMNSITNAGHRKRYVVPNGVVTDMATISNKRSDVALYEFTVEALEGLVYLYFSGNQAAFKQA